jgi:hypothetical protein
MRPCNLKNALYIYTAYVSINTHHSQEPKPSDGTVQLGEDGMDQEDRYQRFTWTP